MHEAGDSKEQGAPLNRSHLYCRALRTCPLAFVRQTLSSHAEVIANRPSRPHHRFPTNRAPSVFPAL